MFIHSLYLFTPTGISLPKKVVDSNQLNESTNINCQIDVDWYLSHGYSKAEDMFREIENKNGK